MPPVHREEVVWQERVAGEVEKIRSKNQERRQEDILRAWRGNRSKINGMMRKRYGEGEWEVSENTVGLGSTKSKATVWTEGGSHDKSRKRQEVELTEMPQVSQPPTMLTWAPIERNVLVENGQQSNIPYFGDEVIDKDHKFISGLVEEVNHKMSMSDNLTDELFIPLVESLTKYDERSVNSKYVVLFKPDTDREKEWVKTSRTDSTLPGLIVFQAIASKFPEFGTTDELIGKYRQLTAQAKRSDFVANLDSVEAASMGAERALHSYKLLLCRRCFLYDCPLHSDPPVDDAAPKLTEQEELSLPSTPCSKDCFRHLPGALAALSPRTPRAARPTNNTSILRPQLCDELNPLRDITGTEKDVWTPAEETFFRVLVQSFPSNWCVIAQTMITKKCRQVYQFSLTDAGPRVKRSRGAVTKPTKPKKVTTKAKQAALYKGHSEGGERENNRTYAPCHHPGQPCKEDVCSCRQVGNFCEKFCYCSIECTHRFPGCKCKKQCITNACACYLASRECDPDLCTTCLDPSLDLNPTTSSCRNVVLQRRMGKKLYVAPSDIAGWGCYIGEKAAKNEFIAEYVGEMISQEESERRGKVYDKAKCSYMFNLNEDFCVDAARMGGKIRFANHSSKPNCKVKILVVAGDHRIGIYANKNIDVGEELFFNYGPDAWDLCYGAKPYSSGDEQDDDPVERPPVRRRRKKRQKTKYNLRQLENQEYRKLAAQFWKQNKSFVWNGSCYSIQNTICSVRLERVADPVSGREEGLSSDSVDDLIKSSSCSERRESSDGLLSSNDQNDDPRRPIRSRKTDGGAQKNNKGPVFPAKVVDDDDVKPLLGSDGGVLPNRIEENRVSLGDIDIIELLGSSDTSESSPTPSTDAALTQVAAHDDLNTDNMGTQNEQKESAPMRISLSDNVEKQKAGPSEQKSGSDVDILELITSDDDQEEEVAAPIIHLTAVGIEEKNRTVPDGQELIATDDEDYVAVMATAKDAAKEDEPEKTEQPPRTRMRYRPGPASSKKGMPSVVYDLSSDDEGGTIGHPDDEGNDADVEEDDVIDVSDNEDGNSYLDHRGSSSEDYDDSDGNSYLEHRGDTSDGFNDGCEENCENSFVIEEEEEEGVCIVGEIRNETIEEEEEMENNANELVVQIEDTDREKVKSNNVVVETIDDEEGNVPSSSPAPFVISEVRTGIGTEAENDWDDILVEEIDARQSSVEPESTPRSRFNHHLPSSSNTQPSSSGGPEVVRLSPPREMVEPEITLLPIASRLEPTAPTSSRPGLVSTTRPVFRSTFAGIAPRPPTASSSRHLLEPPEHQVLRTRSRRSFGGQDNSGLYPQVSSARESPRNEWDPKDTREGTTSNRRRQEWDTNLRLNTVADSSSAPAATKKKRRKQRQRGKKKQKALAEKDIVSDNSGGVAAAQEDRSIDIYLDNDNDVEALD